MAGDTNAEVKVTMGPGDDLERAEIKLRSFGCVSDLVFSQYHLAAVATLSSMDLNRLLEAIALAESLRVEPSQKTIDAIKLVMDRIDYFTEDDPTRLSLEIELEMPIASTGRVTLQPVDVPFTDDQDATGA